LSTRLKVLAVAAVGVAAATIAILIFPRAFPVIGLENRMTQRTALAAADSFFAAHSLADSATRRAVQFGADREALTFVDLAAGGPDTVNALVRGTDVTLFDWSVRAFEPGRVHEASVSFATDGRVVGFKRTLSDTVARPDVGADSAGALARHVLTTWLGEPAERWKVAATSFVTKKPSERVDRTVTFERTDKKVASAPLRLDVIVGGDIPTSARPYVHVPEDFNRRYAEMRSANDLLAIFATIGALMLFGLGVWTIRRFSHHGLLRWRPSLIAGGVIGALLTVAGFNSLAAGWYVYDTAMPAPIFQAVLIFGAIAAGVFGALLTGLTLVAAEAATRTAFPHHLDWWKLWKNRGTREVAAEVGGGYVVAAIAFAYVASFYMLTRGLLGWWVPSEVMDDPNQIATAAPWITGLAASLQAGVWEEALFRALPLSLLSLWVGTRPHRDRWMNAGIIATALVFGFAHANYPSWPPYSRGVEIFIDACFWGVLFVRFGLLVTVLAHFVYDLVLFSMFTATGTAFEYRLAAGIAFVILLLPALVVLWRLIRQRGFAPLSADARFGAWLKEPLAAPMAAPPPQVAIGELSSRSRQLAFIALGGAVVLALIVPGRDLLGPDFTASRDRVGAVADSMLAAKGTSPAQWKRLMTTANDTQLALRRFLRENKLDSLAVPLAKSYATPAWWVARYVNTTGSVAERAEEWRVRVYPDGKPFDVRHVVSDSAPGDSLAADSVRRIASRAAADAGVDLSRYRESDFEETPRPRRRDTQVTWTDTTLKLPAGANGRVWVSLAGGEPLAVRRGVQLPETFVRSAREKDTRTMALTGLLAVILLGALVSGLVYAGRSRPALVHDEVVSGNVKWIWIGIVALAVLAGTGNDFRDTLFGYDTSSPWLNHLTTLAVTGMITPVAAAAVLAGIWALMEMLRRRSGIVAWPAPERVRDSVIAGLGIAGALELSTLASNAVDSSEMPATPMTSLNQYLPMLSEVLGLPPSFVAQVAFGALVPLVIFVVARTNRMRWLIFAAAVVVSGALLAPVASSLSSGPPDAPSGAVGIFGFIVTISAIVHWGPRSALTWLVAGLASLIITSLHGIVLAGTNVERMAAALAVAVCCASLYALIRYAVTAHPQPHSAQR
jgi:hypothetical protein